MRHARFVKSNNRTAYWLDLGNNSASGQFVLGQPWNARNRLRGKARTVNELGCSGRRQRPAKPHYCCSAVEALERQEPFSQSDARRKCSDNACTPLTLRKDRAPRHFLQCCDGRRRCLSILNSGGRPAFATGRCKPKAADSLDPDHPGDQKLLSNSQGGSSSCSKSLFPSCAIARCS